MKIKFIEGNILEVDMVQSNISILKECDFLDDETYIHMSEDISKDDRNKIIGIEMKDNRELYDYITEKQEYFCNKFLEINNLKENVLFINKDAIFININDKSDIENLEFEISDYIKFDIKMDAISMLEFPVNENSNRVIQIFLIYDKLGFSLKSRYTKINKTDNNIEFYNDIIYRLIDLSLNNKDMLFEDNDYINCNCDNILDGVDNRYLLECLNNIKK